MSKVFRWSTIVFFAILLSACGGSESVDEFADDMSEGETFWEPGEWAFNVELVPWPVSPGSPATLRAVATMDDYEQMFSGTVSYRLAPDGDLPGDWQSMTEVGQDDGDMVFESSVSLPKGEVGIHFEIVRRNDNTHHELTDWAVRVK